jgi:hypothetical protein
MIPDADFDCSDLAGPLPIVPDSKPWERVDAMEHRRKHDHRRND